jgi:hypothetical protein
VNFSSIWVVNSFTIFHAFFNNFFKCNLVTKTAQRLKDMVPKKEYFFVHRTLGSHFFIFVFPHGFARQHLQYDCYNLNVRSLLFLKKFYKFGGLGVLNEDIVYKKNSTSLLLSCLKLRIGLHMINLILK